MWYHFFLQNTNTIIQECLDKINKKTNIGNEKVGMVPVSRILLCIKLYIYDDKVQLIFSCITISLIN